MIRAHGLEKRFDGYAAVQDVSLEVPRGERHAVIGPNGAGKTTLFNLLSGELKPDAGEVRLEDRVITDLSPDRRCRLGIGRSFQRNSLFSEFSVQQNLAMACALSERRTGVFWRPLAAMAELQTRAIALAREMQIDAELDARVGHLSYGAQRQLEIAMALASRPRVLLLDEPTSGMSPEETTQVQALIAGLPRELTVIIIEHDMDVVFSIADRVTVLDYGRILATGTPAEIARSSAVQARYLGPGSA